MAMGGSPEYNKLTALFHQNALFAWALKLAVPQTNLYSTRRTPTSSERLINKVPDDGKYTLLLKRYYVEKQCSIH